MKICIPTEDDRGVAGRAFGHFGLAPFFTLVDADDGSVEVLPNPACHTRPESCHHIRLLQAHAVGVVVGEGIGRNAAAALAGAGIEARAPGGATVAEIVEMFRRGKTQPVTAGGCGEGHGRRRRARHRHGG